MILPPYPQQGFTVSAQWGRQVVDALRANRPKAGKGLREIPGSDGVILESTAQQVQQVTTSTNNWLALCDLGIKSIVGNVITLNSGSVLVGDDEYTVAEAAFTLVAPVSYLGWESPYASAAAYWQNFGATKPVPDSFGLRRWYYAIGCTATAVEGHETTYTLAILRYGFLNGYAPANFDT